MRHGKRIKKLGRTHEHRKAMFINLATSLLKHERIKTTLPKAKVLRAYIEPIITKAKKANQVSDEGQILHQKREVMKKIKDRKAVVRLFEDIALRYMNRNGGYTRIFKLGHRKGDNAPMALIELVEEKLEDAGNAAKHKTTAETKTKMGKTTQKTKVEKTEKTEKVENKDVDAKDTKESPAE